MKIYTKIVFDKDNNLISVKDYGYSMDGKFPDMSGSSSVSSVRPNKRETITQIAKITSPAFAKKIYQHVNKVNESVNEASKLAMGIAGFTGTRGIAVDDFIQKIQYLYFIYLTFVTACHFLPHF